MHENVAGSLHTALYGLSNATFANMNTRNDFLREARQKFIEEKPENVDIAKLQIDGSTQQICVAVDGGDLSDFPHEVLIDAETAPVTTIAPTSLGAENDTDGEIRITMYIPLDLRKERGNCRTCVLPSKIWCARFYRSLHGTCFIR